MKILYGVQGTGNGHITRARVMAKALKKTNIDVDWLFSGRINNDYFDMECFDNYQSYRGLTFTIDKGKISIIKTATNLRPLQLIKDIRRLDLSSYDLIINDFEPISAWAARQQKKPTIGLSHQCAFLYDIPKAGNNFVTELFMKWFAPVETPIGIHWHDFNANILPPIVETSTVTRKIDNHYLVYFPFQSLKSLIALFEPFTEQEFYIYYGVTEAQDIGHIHIRPFSRQGFQDDLHKTSGVICGAGFELPSEAMILGKKLLVQPIKGQMEQQSNAFALNKLNMATVCHKFNHEVIKHWLNNNTENTHSFPNVAEQFTHWLERGDHSNISSLNQALWQEVSIN